MRKRSSGSWPRANERAGLLCEIEEEARATQPYHQRPGFRPSVLDAMARVPRHEFVAAEEQAVAYANHPLPIGYGQTISQPYIVALMTELLDLDSGDRVLEIGTGCGYQTAVLAELVAEVYSVELVGELAKRARATLRRLGYQGVEILHGDGFSGWPEHAPYDAIIVTAAPRDLPEALVEQLALGGRLVLPLDEGGYGQMLLRLEKQADGELKVQRVLPVAFVPMIPERALAGGKRWER